MGKPRKVNKSKKFNYSKDRKRAWKRSRKLPTIECKPIKKVWNQKKSVSQNMRDMGLSADPNKTIRIPRTRDCFAGSVDLEDMETELPVKQTKAKKGKKSHVAEELEAQATAPQQKTLRLSEPEIRYCVYMMEKYGEDYKAMARDRKNYFQDTPKQIKHKINVFKSIPEQFKAYMKVRGTDVVSSKTDNATPRKNVIETSMAPQRRATRTYKAKRRNGHYTTPPGRVPLPSKQTRYNAVPLHQAKRKLQFGRTPPKARSPTVTQAQTKGEKRGKKDSKSKSSPKKKGGCMSRELLKLLDMANCMFPWRLRSSTKSSSHCHGDQPSRSRGYPLHHSPEQLRLNILRGQ